MDCIPSPFGAPHVITCYAGLQFTMDLEEYRLSIISPVTIG